jgi:hypothetical protein
LEEHIASIFRIEYLYSEEKGDMFLRNVDKHLQDYTESQPEDSNPKEFTQIKHAKSG